MELPQFDYQDLIKITELVFRQESVSPDTFHSSSLRKEMGVLVISDGHALSKMAFDFGLPHN